MVLRIIQSTPVFSTRREVVGICIGAFFSIIIVMILIILTTFILTKKKKNRTVSSHEDFIQANCIITEKYKPTDPSVWTVNSDTQSEQALDMNKEENHCFEISESPTSSNLSLQTRPSSSESNIGKFSKEDFIKECLSTPATKPSNSIDVTVRNSQKSFNPQHLGHFDPCTDVSTVTRPNTADSLTYCETPKLPIRIKVKPL